MTDNGLIYVGKTCNFNERKRNHKYNARNYVEKYKNVRLYQSIKENGGWDNWKMIEIHKTDNITYRQAEAIEEDYRVKLDAKLNMVRSYITKEQEIERNKEFKAKQYQQIKEAMSEKIICECGREICLGSLRRHMKTNVHKYIISHMD